MAILGTPIVTRLAKARGLVDTPGVRKVHKRPIPRVGGIALVVAMLALVIPVLLLDNTIGEAFRSVQAKVIMLLVAAVFAFAVGLIDDIRNVRANLKLLCLVGGALAVCASGARIDSIAFGSLFELQLGWASWPVTVLWIVGVTVALNFIDGLGQLASGKRAIVCGTICLFALHGGQIVMAALVQALLGELGGVCVSQLAPGEDLHGRWWSDVHQH